jgi:membrane associated rhomboid family serine protease
MRRDPFETRRSATLMLVIVNAILFVVQCSYYGYPPRPRLNDYFALSGAGLQHGYVWQLLTFQFMHANVWHLVFNCWAIYMFGREVEEALGRNRFLFLYFSSGVIGGLLQVLAGLMFGGRFAESVVGASAGGFGLVAAFATLYPERPLILLLFFVIPVNMRAKFLLLFSALLALFGIAFPVDNIANAAHLGGMVTGVLFIRFASQWQWPSFKQNRDKPSRRLVKVPSLKSSGWGRMAGSDADELPPDEFLSKQVDPILDKISAHGIQSLTERERRILEAARTKMGKRG